MDRFTGERPGRGPGFAYDEARHLAAYLFAGEHVHGRAVLDAGCGEGFGTVLLADGARSVLGIDRDPDAVAAARRAHVRPNLEFRRLDVASLPTIGRCFDLVTNFQVIEHLDDPVPFLTAVSGVLGDGGTLVLTTPNRLTSASENPYHVREYTADELQQVLEKVFRRVTVHALVGNPRVQEFEQARARQVRRILRLDPLGLRHLLPAGVVRTVFARLSILVRRRVADEASGTCAITPADFTVIDDRCPDAIDLIAICSL